MGNELISLLKKTFFLPKYGLKNVIKKIFTNPFHPIKLKDPETCFFFCMHTHMKPRSIIGDNILTFVFIKGQYRSKIGMLWAGDK